MISITYAVPFWHPFAEIIESLLPSPWPDWADAQNVKEASSCWAVNWAWIGPTCSRSIGYSNDSSPKTYQTLSCHGSIPNSLMSCEQQRLCRSDTILSRFCPLFLFRRPPCCLESDRNTLPFIHRAERSRRSRYKLKRQKKTYNTCILFYLFLLEKKICEILSLNGPAKF